MILDMFISNSTLMRCHNQLQSYDKIFCSMADKRSIGFSCNNMKYYIQLKLSA